VAAYLLTLRPVGLPAQAPDAVARGRALFARADVGCAGCHAGPAFTDGQRYALFEGRYDTPTLRGVAVTAPYLHDGRYETLGALLDDLGGQMGDTRGLSADEKRDLEAYLRSL
jgi:cytochrome c peroxidase